MTVFSTKKIFVIALKPELFIVKPYTFLLAFVITLFLVYSMIDVKVFYIF